MRAASKIFFKQVVAVEAHILSAAFRENWTQIEHAPVGRKIITMTARKKGIIICVTIPIWTEPDDPGWSVKFRHQIDRLRFHVNVVGHFSQIAYSTFAIGYS